MNHYDSQRNTEEKVNTQKVPLDYYMILEKPQHKSINPVLDIRKSLMSSNCDATLSKHNMHLTEFVNFQYIEMTS
jgi:hypothetical protein